MKRLALFFLSFIFLFSSCSQIAYAQPSQRVPLIVVPGFSSSALYLQDENGGQKRIWGFDFDDILALLFKNIESLDVSSREDEKENIQSLADKFGRQLVKVLGKLTCKPDGSSLFPISPYSNEPEKSSFEYLEKHEPDLIHEPLLTKAFAEKLGAENVFYFHVDFRQGAIDCAKSLRAYVEKVKAYTGSEKTSIYALSHGGQVTAAYLHLYGTKDDLENVVLNAPALGGAVLAKDILTGELNIDLQALLAFAETSQLSESQFSWLLRPDSFDALNEVLQQSLPYIYSIIKYWGSIWDFVPKEHYEQLKERLLNSAESSDIILNSNKMHYAVMPRYAQSFWECRNAGVKLSIIAATGRAGISGTQENSDAIISTQSAAGAVCAPLGKRFADGYKAGGGGCKNPAHNHVSPSMEVDASYAYLPEHTWFIDGQFHGQSYWDNYSRELIYKLLLTNEIRDVHSSPEFPQFHVSTNPRDAVFIRFDTSSEGYISSSDTHLIVTNLSQHYPLKILSLIVKGMNIQFKTQGVDELQVGESVQLYFKGKVPDSSRTRAAITLNYYQRDTFSLFKSRTFDFTIMGGKEVLYDPASPFDEVNFPETLSEKLNEKADALLTRLRLKEFFSIVYNSVQDFIDRFLNPAHKYNV